MGKGISKLIMDLTVRLTCVNGKVKTNSRFDFSFAKDQMCGKSNFSSRALARSHFRAKQTNKRTNQLFLYVQKSTDNCFYLFIYLFYNIYRTNTYTTYNTNIILTYIYVALLILTVFIQASRTNTYTTYNTSIIIVLLIYLFFYLQIASSTYTTSTDNCYLIPVDNKNSILILNKGRTDLPCEQLVSPTLPERETTTSNR